MKTKLLVLLMTIVLASCTNTDASKSSFSSTSFDEVQWGHLNPKRGHHGPRAANLWGNIQSDQPTGFLAKFKDGFSSPPHIHNRTYRAVVISGLVHNADEKAPKMWMPKGSFWTQPKGQSHITAAKGSNNIALVEIDFGPYLVLPPSKAFDSGERPINVDASNIVWVDTKSQAKIAYLWGNLAKEQSNGTFVKIPAGTSIELISNDSTLRAVVITGEALHDSSKTKSLPAGSFFTSSGVHNHKITAKGSKELIIYIRTKGQYTIK